LGNWEISHFCSVIKTILLVNESSPLVHWEIYGDHVFLRFVVCVLISKYNGETYSNNDKGSSSLKFSIFALICQLT